MWYTSGNVLDMEKYMVDTVKLAEEIYDMMKENDGFRNEYKKSLVGSSQTTERVFTIGEIYGKAIDRKLKLLELCMLKESMNDQ